MNEIIKKLFIYNDVIKNQIYNTLNFLFVTLISIVTLKLITNYFSPNDYGSFKYVLAVIQLLAITTISGFNKTIGGYVIKGYHGTVKRANQLSFKTGSIGIVILIGLSLYSIFQKKNTLEAIFFFTAAICFYPWTIYSRYQAILSGLEKFKKLLLLSIIQRTVNFCSIIVIVLILRKGILLYGISQLILTSFLFTLFYFSSIKNLNNSKIDSGFLKHSIVLSFVSIGSQIINPGIQLVIGNILGSSALAYYAIGDQIPRQLASIVKPIMHPLSMYLAKRGKKGYNKAVLKLIPFTIFFGLLLYCLLYLILIVAAPYIISEQYYESIYYAKFLGLFIILSPTYSILSSNLIVEKNNKGYAASLYANQAITFFGYIIFIVKYGIPTIGIINFISLAIEISIMCYFIVSDT